MCLSNMPTENPLTSSAFRKWPAHLTRLCYSEFPFGLALFAITFAAYWPARNGDLILDDVLHVTPPRMRSFDGLWRIWFQIDAAPQYYPILHTAFWLESLLWPENIPAYHIANITQHAISAVLVFLIMRRLALPGAWIGAVIFTLHPVCVESVAWISEQKNTLSLMFALLSLFV